MGLLNTYNQNKLPQCQGLTLALGFTLIEIIVVVAIFVAVISFAMIIDLNVFKGDTFLSEQSTIVNVLSRARSKAMANMDDTNYGVCYVDANYIIFRGDNCQSGENIPANINIISNPKTTSPFPVVVFSRLSGNLIINNEIIIHIEDGIKKADIKINNEGAINW